MRKVEPGQILSRDKRGQPLFGNVHKTKQKKQKGNEHVGQRLCPPKAQPFSSVQQAVADGLCKTGWHSAAILGRVESKKVVLSAPCPSSFLPLCARISTWYQAHGKKNQGIVYYSFLSICLGDGAFFFAHRLEKKIFLLICRPD
ncbi:hypothetical protein E2320_013595 [Naja naja]|nr:hypothetical protein E2320_013595 [Naja naja]